MARIKIIGLDGGTYEIIDYLVDQGRLPNFARVINEGARAVLNSTHPPLTPAAWSAFYTGTNPGRTGAVDFFHRAPGTYRLSPVNGSTVQGEPFWSVAGRSGKRVCVYNVPVTYPARAVNGIMISGMDAPRLDKAAVYPESLHEEILQRFPDIEVEPSIDARYLVRHSDDPEGEYIRRFEVYLETQIGMVRYLSGLEDWDLFLAVFRSPDGFQHAFWRDAMALISGKDISVGERRRGESILSCYERLDAELGEMLDSQAPDETLIIMSDHGFGQLQGEVCVNRILADAGLLSFKHHRIIRQLKEKVFSTVSARIKQATREKILRRLNRDEKAGVLFVDSLISDIDWEQTRMYSIGQFGCLYLNRKGREPLGVIASDEEAVAVLDEAEAALRAYAHPDDGERLFTEFYRGEDIYSGPMQHSLPDMVVVMRDHAYRGVYSTSAELAAEPLIRMPCPEWEQLAPTGCHRREGILLMHGPEIVHADLGSRDIIDIAPTLLNILGLPGGDVCDGSIIADALKDGAREAMDGALIPDMAAPDSGDEPVYSEEDEEAVRKRLEDLGYL